MGQGCDLAYVTVNGNEAPKVEPLNLKIGRGSWIVVVQRQVVCLGV